MFGELDTIACPVCKRIVGAYRIHNGTELRLGGLYVPGNGPAFIRDHDNCAGSHMQVLPAAVPRGGAEIAGR